MSAALVLLNLAYVALVLASLTRRMMYLRMLLAGGSLCFVAFGLLDDNLSIVIWNAVIGAMHLQQLALLVMEQRRARTTDQEDEIRMTHFPGLDRVEFRTLWSLSKQLWLEDERFITQGTGQEDIHLILHGKVTVHSNGKLAATLGPGSVVGEMSRNSGGTATADCAALGAVEVRTWGHDQLAELRASCPAALLAFEYLVQRDLVAKILADNQAL